MKAIFMVGEQRSGSNLLRLIMNQSTDIAAPHPPHILQRMMPLMHLYGDLSDEGRFMSLIDDVCRLVEHNPVPWDRVALNRMDIRERCRKNSLVAAYGAVMDVYAESHDASAWICKSMQNIRWADQLDDYFEDGKYLYLYRDPRDVALSFSKAVIGEKHPYFIAKQWTRLQEMCIQQRDRIGDDRFFSLCYEELTSNPQNVVENLCQFLDIDFNPEMLSFHRSDEANRTAVSSDLWSNLTQPIMTNNSQKFLGAMPEEDIRTVEAVAGHVMDELGYKRCIVQPGEKVIFSDTEINQYHQLNETRKQEREKTAEPEDLSRRQKQSQVLNDIEHRLKHVSLAGINEGDVAAVNVCY